METFGVLGLTGFMLSAYLYTEHGKVKKRLDALEQQLKNAKSRPEKSD